MVMLYAMIQLTVPLSDTFWKQRSYLENDGRYKKNSFYKAVDFTTFSIKWCLTCRNNFIRSPEIEFVLYPRHHVYDKLLSLYSRTYVI